jgi:hypothetical protein
MHYEYMQVNRRPLLAKRHLQSRRGGDAYRNWRWQATHYSDGHSTGIEGLLVVIMKREAAKIFWQTFILNTAVVIVGDGRIIS